MTGSPRVVAALRHPSFCILHFAFCNLHSSSPAARAEQAPHVAYAFPAGGRQASEFQVKIGGQFLDGLAAAHVSGRGVEVKVVELHKPMTQQEVNALREKLRALQEKKFGVKPGAGPKPGPRPAISPAWTAADEQMLVEIRRKLAKFLARPNPALAETATLRSSSPATPRRASASCGLETPAGLSNPLAFCVGQLPELVRKEPAEAVDPPRDRPLVPGPQSPVAPSPIVNISLPLVVNNQVLAGQVDRYRLQASKGQQLVVAVTARS